MRSRAWPILLALATVNPTPGVADDAKPLSTRLSIDTRLSDLLDRPAARAVLERDWMKGVTTAPEMQNVMSMSLRGIAQYPQSRLDDETLARIDADLARIDAP